VDRSDQMSYYTFAKKTVSGGRNFSFVCSTWQWWMHTSCITNLAKKNVTGNFLRKSYWRIAC
jgi:hypothetical protein